MDYPRPCGCKGCRVCLLCEQGYGIQTKDYGRIFRETENQLVFCPECCKCYRGWEIAQILAEHPNHNDEMGIDFPGVLVKTDFIDLVEQQNLMKGIDEMSWDISQSGRRKQNFGPKTNFKKMKLKMGNFQGFPQFTQFVQHRFHTIPLLQNFQTIEQCTLEYDPMKGAAIDPHIDDCWIWGERVVTVNCLGDSVLTLTNYKGDGKRYNLPLVANYKSQLITNLMDETKLHDMKDQVIRIPMPNRSLIVLYGPARYQWEHCVLREDITVRRVCLAYREFTPDYLHNGSLFNQSNGILQQSLQFWNHHTTQQRSE